MPRIKDKTLLGPQPDQSLVVWNPDTDRTDRILLGRSGYSVVATEDQSKTSSSTLANDLELFLPVKAGVIAIYANLFFQQAGSGPSGWRYAFTLPSNDGNWKQSGTPNSTSSVATVSLTENRVVSTSNTGVRQVTIFGGAVLTADGTLRLQWAQNSSSATESTRLASSVLTVWHHS
jgi:hypothetical protein